MPTIDELEPATAVSDIDELLVSQNGVARRTTRAQMLAGIQPQIALGSEMLLGRLSSGTGGPEQIVIGANLNVANGALSADATPFVITSLRAGTVPADSDLVPLGQGNNNTAVTYSQFMSGLAGIDNVDISNLLVTPTGNTASYALSDFAANVLPLAGGTLTGGLVLASDPTTTQQAATKRYVDTQLSTALSTSGGTLTGPITLSADPSASLQAATKQYVDFQVTTVVPKAGASLTGALILASDPTVPLQAATKEYVDARVSRGGDTLTGPLVLSADPTVALQAATKQYVDNITSTSLPKTGGALTGSLTLAADPTTPLLAATKHYVDAQVTTALPVSGGSMTGALVLAANPIAPMHATTKQYVDGQVGSALPLQGGNLTGPLTLAADPTSSLHAATKHYVDTTGSTLTGVINVKAAPYGAQLNGTADDTAAFKAAYQAASVGSAIYVPNGVTVLQNPNNWGVPLTKRVKWIVDGTSLPDGTSLSDGIPGGNGPANGFLPGIVVGNSNTSAEFSQTGSAPSDFAVLHSSYVVNHNGGPVGGGVISNAHHDTIIYGSPNNYVWGGIDRLLWCGTQTPSAGSPAEHVGRYIQTIRQNIGTDLNGKPLPQPQLWAACLEYRDTTGQPSSWAGASLTVEMDWVGNGPDDGNSRQIQSLVVAQNSPSGAPVEISSVVGIYLGGGSTGHAYRVFNIGIPFSIAVLDTTQSQQMAGAAAIRLAAGHAIAFEASNSNRLSYDANCSVLRWYQGTSSYPVGKGISVGPLSVISANATLVASQAGDMIILAGNGSQYAITLPAASTVAGGTGFTFTVTGSAIVTIVLSGIDTIDGGPVTLRPNDRFQVVSDSISNWREVFRTNAVNPHFSGPPSLPSFTVSSLPMSPGAGAMAFASNGRKPSETAGVGSGVGVFYDGARWISVCSGSPVVA